MGFTHQAFRFALAFLGQANHKFNHTSFDPLDFMRALIYFQPYTFPSETLVAILLAVNARTWAKIYILARTFFPQDRTMINILENYNLWQVRMPRHRFITGWKNFHSFCAIARDAHRLYRHYASHSKICKALQD